ncbi:MAG: CHAD domain-containing protein [Solirubrobacterales bacterium]|nr:CHAD domain-containing protein [Solirubrobacterales bacterium]
MVAELDVFEGDLAGTSVVEVEFSSERAARRFRPPSWFGRELTGDRAWANQSLAVAGLPDRKGEFRLRGGEDPGIGVARVIAARAAQASAAVRRADAATDPAADVHEARKSLKKIRSSLRLLRGTIPDQERKAANSSCREAAAGLAGARDATVKIETLDGVAPNLPGGSGGAAWRRDLEREADGHRDDLTPDRLRRVTDLIEGVRIDFVGRDPGADPEQVAGNLGRSYRRGRRAMRRARKSESAADLHAWRKRAKDLRYQLEILEPRLPEFADMRRRAEELADKLGDLHDLDVLAGDLVGRGLGEAEAARLRESISEARERLLDHCLRLGERTYRLKPGRFTNEIAESLGDAA